jgi:DNA polymerase-3 subunit alpha
MFQDLVNVKSVFNFLSSTIKTENYFDFVEKNNLNAAFQIDTNNMYNAVDFYFAAKKKNIKPIVGVELEFVEFNLILIPKNNFGYQEVTKLFSSYALDANNILGNKNFKNEIKNCFLIIRPKKNSWKNIIDVDANEILIGVDRTNKSFVGKEDTDNIIFAGDVNVLQNSDQTFLNVLGAIKNGVTLNEYKNEMIKKFLTVDELKEFVDVNIHQKNISKIINEVSDDVIKNSQPKIVEFKNNLNISSKNYLQKVCEDKLENLFFENVLPVKDKEVYVDRLNMELETIFQMGFENYFLVVADFVNYAKENEIIVGPGRGSAASSLVSFVLNITEIDPIKYNLLFERFLNPKRVSMPDIDIDFQDNRRQEVLEYIANKYQNYFAQISTFQTMGIKNAIRDCAKILNISDDDVNAALKNLDGTQIEFSDELFEKNLKLKKLCSENNMLLQYAKFLIGLPRQSGTHAAGIIISSIPIDEIIPVSSGGNGLIQSQYPAKHLEDLGLIKIDILGLRNLTILNEIKNQIMKSRSQEINFRNIPLDDQETFKLLIKGETSSIFQFESNGMIDTLKKVRPSSIVDLASAMALFRPGPMEFIPDFVANKTAKKIQTGFGFDVDEILKETYGIIVYQEQIMRIIQFYAGLDLNRADLIRSAISKKNEAVLKSFRTEFINSAIQMEHQEEDAARIWDHIQKFAKYGFNKAHAISYSVISYWLAYFKSHYRAEFTAAILNAAIKDRTKTVNTLHEFKKYGGQITGPSIRNLITKYRVTNGVINMPLTSVKSVSSVLVEQFTSALKQNPDVLKDKKNLFGVLLTINNSFLTKEIFDNLIKAGVFDWYQESRTTLLKFDLEILRWMSCWTSDLDLFEIDEDEKVADNDFMIDYYETEAIGFAVSVDLLMNIRKKYSDINTIMISNINRETNTINVLGRIENISTHKDKNGDEMVFIEFADETGKISITVFASIYKNIKTSFVLNNYYILNIRVQIVEGQARGVLKEIVKKDLIL